VTIKLNKKFNAAWLGVFLFILSVSSPWFSVTISDHSFVKAYFATIGLAFLMLLSLYFNSYRSEVNLKINYLKLSLLLLFIFGTLSIFWSINFDFTVGKWLLWLITAFSFIISLNLSTSNKDLVNLAWYLIVSAGTIAFIGILQYYFDPFTLSQAAKPASTFGNKNMAVQPLVLIFPLSIFLLFSKFVQHYKVWLLLGIISIIVTYIFLTETRSAWLSIFIELTFIISYLIVRKSKSSLLLDWNTNKRNACIIGILLILFLIHLNPSGEFRNAFADIFQIITATGDASDGSSLERIQIWQTSIQMIYDAPFIGTGLGSYSQNLANEGFATWTINNTTHVHNDLLELAVEIGITGLIIFFIVIISLVISIIKILKKTVGEAHLFIFILFVCFIGSFINLQFSFPYQLAFPLILFGLYAGIIANYIDLIDQPLININFLLKIVYKKIILFFLLLLLLTVFFFTYFKWFNAYNQIDKINILDNFDQIEQIEMPINYKGVQYILYSLGGKFFDKGKFEKSRIIDKQFLKTWPNHLDVLFRNAYAEHKIGKNSVAIELAKKLKKIEPKGLYNAYIIEMFVYLDTKKTTKLEQTFHQLYTQSDEFLKLNDDTYRLMIFFTLASKNLSKYAPALYEKYMENHKYSCEVENNLAIHYFNLENYSKSTMHVNRTNGQEQECLNPDLIRLLSEMNFID